jgi:hypothetical protein
MPDRFKVAVANFKRDGLATRNYGVYENSPSDHGDLNTDPFGRVRSA